MRGIDIGELTLQRLCNVVYAHVIEEAGPLADTAEVRKQVDQALKKAEGLARPKGSTTAITATEAESILRAVSAERQVG